MEEHGILPLHFDDGRVVVATWLDDVDIQAIDDLELLFDARIDLVRGTESEIRDTIGRICADDMTAENVIAGLEPDVHSMLNADPALDDLVSLANEAPVVKLVNLLLIEALEARASDVHLESNADGLRVRYRIDGVLQDAAAPPAHFRTAIVSRLKIMAELDIAERRTPQDGRIRLRLRDRDVDVRVSTLPALHGESVVLRLLDRQRGRIGLEEIGMGPATLTAFANSITRPNGIVLATGPTGSGKTTTLYAAIDHIRTGREKILAVEDPVEYELRGVPQIPVNEKAGLSFAVALRALLRQDPDVLLVGEIRDGETARIATHAALTGHLVLSTLHTNDAAAALTRLIDLGVEPYLVASTVEAVMAQRLVRKVCQSCVTPVAITASDAKALGADAADLSEGVVGRGCEACRQSGYLGRTGIYELMVVDDEIRSLIPDHTSARDLATAAIRGGMATLRQDGLRLIRAGITTVEEVLRVTQA
jgi:type II secretory ATPase GspE/PulE/Tfp pilus assembly ATPase PilB-like protein